MLHRNLTGALLALVPTQAVPGQICTNIQNVQPGASVPLGDDEVRMFLMPFPFAVGGVADRRITVSSNGFVWFGDLSGQPADPTPSVGEMAGSMRMALCWADWNPSLGGGVFYNESPTQVSIVWRDVPLAGAPSVRANMELVIHVTGLIDFHYAANMGVPTSSCLAGMAIVGSNPVDLSAQLALPFATFPSGTGFETFAGGAFDLVGTTMRLQDLGLPSAAPDFRAFAATPVACPQTPPPVLSETSNFGIGCPPPPASTGTYFEQFPQNAFDLSNTSFVFSPVGGQSWNAAAGTLPLLPTTSAHDLQIGDDDQVTVSLASIGGFVFGGVPLSSVRVCSNGFVWLGDDAATDFSPTADEFASGTARLAPCWHDWDPTSGFGAVRWTATPTYCAATWFNVPAWGTAQTGTFQVVFRPSGSIEFRYGAVANSATSFGGEPAIAGLSGGNSTSTAPVDLSAVIVSGFDLTPQATSRFDIVARSRPQLGFSFDTQLRDVPAGTNFGLMVLSFAQVTTDLTPLGAPGCTRYVGSGTNVLLFPVGTTMSYSLTVPNIAAFAGIDLFLQGFSFTSGYNALGIVTSDGLAATVGL